MSNSLENLFHFKSNDEEKISIKKRVEITKTINKQLAETKKIGTKTLLAEKELENSEIHQKKLLKHFIDEGNENKVFADELHNLREENNR